VRVLIDANIYLRFYENPKDSRRALVGVAELGSTLVFPEQVWREFRRNRGTLVAAAMDALKTPAGMPRLAFLDELPAMANAQKFHETYSSALGVLRGEVQRIATDTRLDVLFREVESLYAGATKIGTTPGLLRAAQERALRGDPPMTSEKKWLSERFDGSADA